MRLTRLKEEEFFGKDTIYGRIRLTGKTYMTPMYGQLRRIVEGECDCGTIRMYVAQSLRLGLTKSCGCFQRENTSKIHRKHGLSKHPLYLVHQEMLKRCYIESNESFKNYGGRGIGVCDEWQSNFLSFYNWAVENGYQSGRSLDRIDNDGNYEPGNCRFAERDVQSRNNRRNRMYTAFGETKCLFDWGKDPRCVVSVWGLRSRVVRERWDDFEKALTSHAEERKCISRRSKHAKMLTAFGETKCYSEWLEDERCLVKKDTLVDRLSKGFDAESAISLPPKRPNGYSKKMLQV